MHRHVTGTLEQERTIGRIGDLHRDTVLVLHLNKLAGARRVRRQVEFLAREYDVIVGAFDRPSYLPAAEFVELTPAQPSVMRRNGESAIRAALRLAGLYERAYWADARMRRWQERLQQVPAVRAVIVNDLAGLPLAFAVAGGARVVFDAHEHWTSESASWARRQRMSMRKAHDWIVDCYVPRTGGVMTVSDGIARAYHERTGVSPCLVTNAPPFRSLQPSSVGEPIRLLHIGLADERRRLEDAIDAVRSIDRGFTFDLVLAGNNAYRKRLERYVARDAHIRVLPPVAADDLISFSNRYDVGVFLLPGYFPNYVHVLPNKLFDYIQARLAVAIGPSPEMVKIVEEWDCGIVSPSFAPEAFAATLDGLTVELVERMKQNSDRAAHVLTAENNREIVLDLVRRGIGNTETATEWAR